MERLEIAAAPRVLSIRADGTWVPALSAAVSVLASGGLVAYPTESFYGLAADATQAPAVSRVFVVKQRRFDQPLLILIPARSQLERYVTRVPSVAQRLMDRFWPGPLTLVFEAESRLPPVLTGGRGKVGIRLSSHPVAAALAREYGRPITGTSANISHATPSQTAQEVVAAMGSAVDLVLDGGSTPGNLGSTILDVTVTPPEVLREGLVSCAELQEIL